MKEDFPWEESEDEFRRRMIEAAEHARRLADDGSRHDYGVRLVYDASQMALRQAEIDGLAALLDVRERRWRYMPRQAVEAACVSRQDAAATLMLMAHVLNNQARIKRLLWVVVLLLCIIVWRMA